MGSMEVETSYKFDADASVADVSAFLRDQHRIRNGLSGSDASAERVDAYSSGDLRLHFLLEHEREESG